MAQRVEAGALVVSSNLRTQLSAQLFDLSMKVVVLVDRQNVLASEVPAVDVFPAGEKPMVRSMLSESLRSVISQTLLKRNGGGRVAAHEIMVGVPAIRNLIREDKVAQMYSAIQTGQNYGMQTLDQCLLDLVNKGIVSKKIAKPRAMDKRLFD